MEFIQQYSTFLNKFKARLGKSTWKKVPKSQHSVGFKPTTELTEYSAELFQNIWPNVYVTKLVVHFIIKIEQNDFKFKFKIISVFGYSVFFRVRLNLK